MVGVGGAENPEPTIQSCPPSSSAGEVVCRFDTSVTMKVGDKGSWGKVLMTRGYGRNCCSVSGSSRGQLE